MFKLSYLPCGPRILARILVDIEAETEAEVLSCVCALSFSRCRAVSKLENRAAGKYGKMQMSMVGVFGGGGRWPSHGV